MEPDIERTERNADGEDDRRVARRIIAFLKQSMGSTALYTTAFLLLYKGGLFGVLFGRYFPRSTDGRSIVVSPKVQIEWISRVLSDVNALFMVLGVTLFIKRNPKHRTDLVFYNSPSATFLSSCFAGYTIYDLALCFLYRKYLFDPTIIFHHILLLTCIFFAHAFKLFSLFGCWLSLNEVSTLFLNQRWFFSTFEKVNHKLPPKVTITNQLLFFVTFFLFRVLLNTLLTLRCFQQAFLEDNPKHSKLSLPSKFAVLGIFPFISLLNWYWFLIINQKLKATLKALSTT